MSLPFHAIAAEALALAPADRLRLAAELIDSVEGPSDPARTGAWSEELARRSQAADAREVRGEARGTEWSEIRARLLSQERGASVHPAISVDPTIMLGKPVVAGTRITVEHILEQLRDGHSIEDLLDGHPRLTREGVQAALDYALEAVRLESVVRAAR